MPATTRRLTWAALAVVGLVACGLHAAPSSDDESAQEPLAAELLEARTVYVMDTMMDFSLTWSFRTALEEWDRFELAESPDEADIVMALTTRTDFTQEDVPSGADADPDDPTLGRAKGTVRIADKLYFKVFVQGGDDLWTDETDLDGNDEAITMLLERLQERMEDQTPEATDGNTSVLQ